MAGKVLVVLAAVASAVAATSIFLASDNEGAFDWATRESGGTSANVIHQASNQGATPPPTAAKQQPAPSPLGFALANAAEQYEQTVKYPPWSVPLTPAQADAYQGNRYEPVSLPLGDNGSFTVILDQYRFTKGDPILVAASIEGPQVISDKVTATLESQPDRKQVATAALDRTGNGYFEGTVDSDQSPGEYHLIVEAHIDGKPVRHASTLTIEPDLGDFKGLGTPYVSNNNLVIPLSFAPDHTGYYALSAQLYNGDNPIAQLQEEQQMGTGTHTFKLRAHGTVLANQSLSGQLQLRHIQLRQLPDKPGDRTHYAFGPDDGYRFSPPDLDQLTDTPAANPESEQRAVLLKQLADKF
ncbi:hypothetical protein ACFQGA_10655 [Marinobacter koreensis]|uniref:Uncharacterized protein n=1 Tax=Marinobacter koreensis TaxID=335974 RepID=A0ABW0RGY7_9GAMM|nr:hypothetical protein [Marinobacter koreensis]MCK7547393.1 hypothetical protein [Marinobacter koreensis]